MLPCLLITNEIREYQRKISKITYAMLRLKVTDLKLKRLNTHTHTQHHSTILRFLLFFLFIYIFFIDILFFTSHTHPSTHEMTECCLQIPIPCSFVACRYFSPFSLKLYQRGTLSLRKPVRLCLPSIFPASDKEPWSSYQYTSVSLNILWIF